MIAQYFQNLFTDIKLVSIRFKNNITYDYIQSLFLYQFFESCLS